jgi:addiction module RelE/StbE family toxin
LRIRWTRAANCDLDAVDDFIGRDDPAAAARTVLRIIDAVEGLADHPHLGRPGRVPGTRELAISGTPYVVPYRMKGGVLEVLRVLHGAMRWPDLSG